MIEFLLTILIIQIPIRQVSFLGNKTLKSNQLISAILSTRDTEYKEINLSYDIHRLKKLYKENGFFRTKIDTRIDTTEKGIIIKFNIEEGERPKIKKIYVRGCKREKIKELFKIRVNDYFIRDRIEKTRKNIEHYFNDHGYPFCNVSVIPKPDNASLEFSIEKDTLYYIGRIQCRGLKQCRPEVIYQEIDFKTGDKFSRKKLLKSQKQIYYLGFFSTVNFEMRTRKPDTIDLIFTMQELKSRLLNFGAGISFPLGFLLSFGIEELNLANRGYRLKINPSFKINIEHEWEAKLEGQYTIRHFTPARLNISILPFLWYEDKIEFIRQTRGNELRLTKLHSENIQTTISQQYKFVDLLPKQPLPDTFRGVTNSLKFQTMFDYRDQFFNPTQGFYLNPSIEFAGGFFGGANNFIRSAIDLRTFINFFKNTAAQRIKFGVLIPTDGVATYEEFYLGGEYSLRGYPDHAAGPDSIGEDRYGNILINYNLEYRISLPYRFGLVLFFDCGYIDNKIDFTKSNFLKTSSGIGLRYFTPIGPLRADFGIPLTENGYGIYLGFYNIF